MLQHFPGKQMRITLFLAYFATQIVAATQRSSKKKPLYLRKFERKC